MKTASRTLKNILFLGFLLSLQMAFTSYISSSFLAGFFGEEHTSFVFVSASILSLGALMLVPRLLKRLGESRFLFFSSFLSALSLFALSLSHTVFVISAVFVI